MSGKHRVRRAPFVQVDSKTVNNPDISFRAIGVLTWLIDKPADWDVRSQAIANSKPDKEGRAAVRTALKELGAVGHYRIERRQLRNGTFEMGTAISAYPDAEWASQWAEYDGKPVPMVEQADGSFKVKRKDGALVDDGFDPEDDPPSGPDSTGDQESNFGTGDQKPDAGSPDLGSPDDGQLVSITRKNTQDDHTGSSSLRSDENPPSSLRSEGTPAEPTEATDAEQPALIPTDEEPYNPARPWYFPKSGKTGVELPEDFHVTPKMREWFDEQGFHGFNAWEQTQMFVDFHTAKGTKHKDWFAAWRLWMRRQQERVDEQAARGSVRGGRSNVTRLPDPPPEVTEQHKSFLRTTGS